MTHRDAGEHDASDADTNDASDGSVSVPDDGGCPTPALGQAEPAARGITRLDPNDIRGWDIVYLVGGDENFAYAVHKATSFALRSRGIPSKHWLRRVRAFKHDFIALHIHAANHYNLVYLIEGLPEENAEITLTTTTSSSVKPEEFGQKILRVFTACRNRRV